MSDLARTVRRYRRQRLFEHGPGTVAVEHDRSVLGRLLRHRGPMLLLDAITAVDLEERALEARRDLREDDGAFDGHFPGDPIYPGSFQVEMMGQLGLTLAWFLGQGRTDVAPDVVPPRVRLIRIDQAYFLREARPNDSLSVLARCLDDNGFTITCVGQLLVSGEIAAVCAYEALYDEEGA